MKLVQGDKGPEVKTLQRALNRFGSMLLVDGDFGASTAQAVLDARQLLDVPPMNGIADDALIARLMALPEPSEELTAPGVAFVGREEVTSPSAYRQKYQFPVWPGPHSGVTIGIGYDLKFADRAKLDMDWGALLPRAVKDRLAKVCGRTGSAALLQQVHDIAIPLPAAMKGFLGRILPQHVSRTRDIYPQLDGLKPAQRTVLISLVFNRGAKLDSADGRRYEMQQIQRLLAAGDFAAVPAQLRAMKRLWNPATEAGLVTRREHEALLWSDGFARLQLD